MAESCRRAVIRSPDARSDLSEILATMWELPVSTLLTLSGDIAGIVRVLDGRRDLDEIFARA